MMLQLIDEIAKLSGNDKIEFISQHPELKELFEWTYNPFKKYYITSPGIKVNCDIGLICYYEEGSFSSEAIGILESLTNRSLSGSQAKEELSDYICKLYKDSAELFQRVIDKDLKCGINTKTINKIWPGLIPETEDGEEKPKVYKCVDFESKWVKFPLLAAPKLDGVRGRYFNGKMYSRSGKLLYGLEHIEHWCRQYSNDLDGELTVPGEIFDVASGLIRNQKDTPNAIFNIFDMPDNIYKKSQRLLKIRDIDIEPHSPLRVIEHEWIHNQDELDIFYQMCLDDGHEGIVVYDPDSFYQDGRGHDWMRIVPIKTEDLHIVDFFEGKGKFKGTLGGIVVVYKGKLCKVGTGFSNELRDTIWSDKDLYVGKYAEIEFKEDSSKGKMRQPRFKRLRPDKDN